jgi:hypothetical protein
MTHMPPKYILDHNVADLNMHSGCEDLRRELCHVKPLLHCFGHLEHAWGARRVLWKAEATKSHDPAVYEVDVDANRGDDALLLPPEVVDKDTSKTCGYATLDVSALKKVVHGKQTLTINAAVGNNNGRMRNVPWVIELELRGRQEHGTDSKMGQTGFMGRRA